ncbi:MAG: hypothetical protein IJV04_01575 [Lachnospiraceae bacterium]|nr:hypothetical protein [Lachnospiraceae bacterium]
MIQRLEQRFGKYAIPHLMNYIIGGYLIGYLVYVASMMTGQSLISFLLLDPHWILRGQIWRLFSWVLLPPIQNIFFEIIMMVFYWQLGRVLEANWGAFRFNLYIFGGILFTIIGAFAVYGIMFAVTGIPVSLNGYFTTEYINLSIFLAFAVCFPDNQVLLYFIIPVKMKWLAIVYGAIVAYDFLIADLPGKVAIVASMLNFLVFFWMHGHKPGAYSYRRYNRSPKGFSFGFGKKGAGAAPGGRPPGPSPFGGRQGGSMNISRHKCCICGRTDISNPDLTFRFCSKCNGNYEYCNDHLFSHQHKS